MANKVTIQQLGSTATKTVDGAETVQQALTLAGITGQFAISINGETAMLDSFLEDFCFISLGESVKGGAAKKQVKKPTKKPSKKK